MNTKEQVLLEAIKNMLGDKVNIGLNQYQESEESKNHTADKAKYNYQLADDMFKIKINSPKISMYESLSGAFYHTHSYKNIFDPSFNESFNKQMVNMVIPENERKLALEYLEEIKEEFLNDDKGVIGNGIPDMNELRKVTQPGVE